MKVVLFANTGWYLYNFRLTFAAALREAGHELLLLSPPDEYGERLREMGFRWVPVPMQRRSLNPIRELRLVHWLARLMKEDGADLVHGFTIKCAVYASLAARMAGIGARVNAVAGMGYVFTSTDLKARLLRPVVKALMRLALDGGSCRLILQNRDDVALFEAAGLVDPGRVRLIRSSGVNCERFRPSAQVRGDATGPTRVLLAARLLWDKGLGEYVDAAKLLLNEGREITFLLAGGPDTGNPAAVPQSLVKQWVSEGLVDWLGHVEDMPSLLASVDMVVLPSYREGLPKGLIEAAACGLPLITTDVPGCREVVTHGVEGLLVPPRDSIALASAIALLAESADLRRSFGAAARHKAQTEFDEKIVLKQTIQVYEELVLPISAESRRTVPT